jgi:hypothetical protein
MSDKLTEQKIEEMIEELLQEEQERLDERSISITNKDLTKITKLRTKLKFDKGNQPDSTPKTKKAVKALRDLDTSKTNRIDDADITAAKNKGSGAEFDLATWLTTSSNNPTHFSDWANILGTTPASGTYHKDVDKTDLAAVGSTPSNQQELDVDDMPISQPTLYSQQASSGKFGGAILQSFNQLFGGASTLKERVAILNDASKAAVGLGGEIKTAVGADLRKQLNLAICLDYINAFAKHMDHGSGAYLFEAFVALITSGTVEGKAMGGEDVLMMSDAGVDILSSAKYYSSKSSEQAVSKFPKNKPVTYVFGYKKTKTSGTTGGSADPDEIVAIDLYIFTVTLANNKKSVTAEGDGTAELSADKKQIELNVSSQNPTATLFLAKSKTKSFQQSLEDQINNKDQQMKDSYNSMKLYFQETYRANTLAKQYLAAKGPSLAKKAGTNSLKAFEEADTHLVSLFNEVGVGSKVDTLDSGGNRTLQESKLHSLDQLIAETMRDIKRKRKK